MFGYGKTGFDDVDELLRAYEKQQRRETIRIISDLIYECFDMFFGCVFRRIISIFKGGRRGFFRRVKSFLGEFLMCIILEPYVVFSLCKTTIIGLIIAVVFFSSIVILAILGSGLVWIPVGIYIYAALLMTSLDTVETGKKSSSEKKRTDREEGFNYDYFKGYNDDHFEGYNDDYFEGYNDDYFKDSNDDHSKGFSDIHQSSGNIFAGLNMMQAKTRYREIMKQVHPDNGGSSEEASDITRQFREYVMQAK